MTGPIDPDGWYTTSQVARYLGCGATSVLTRLKRGLIAGRQLPAVGGGSPRWRVRGDEVLRLVGAAAMSGRAAARRAEFARQDTAAMRELGLV